MVSGAVEPDTYLLVEGGPRLLEARVGHQTHKIVRGPSGRDLRMELDPQTGAQRVLTDDEAIGLARLALQVEQHYGAPQDLEWAIADGAHVAGAVSPDHHVQGAPPRPSTQS